MTGARIGVSISLLIAVGTLVAVCTFIPVSNIFFSRNGRRSRKPGNVGDAEVEEEHSRKSVRSIRHFSKLC